MSLNELLTTTGNAASKPWLNMSANSLEVKTLNAADFKTTAIETGTLTVTGQSTLADVTTQSINNAGDLSVAGTTQLLGAVTTNAVTANGALTVNSTIDATSEIKTTGPVTVGTQLNMPQGALQYFRASRIETNFQGPWAAAILNVAVNYLRINNVVTISISPAIAASAVPDFVTNQVGTPVPVEYRPIATRKQVCLVDDNGLVLGSCIITPAGLINVFADLANNTVFNGAAGSSGWQQAIVFQYHLLDT